MEKDGRVEARECGLPSLPMAVEERCWPMPSNSSMKRMQGAALRAFWNMSRTRLAPTPTNTSMNSVPAAEKNGTPASPAIARASNVLPGQPKKSLSRLKMYVCRHAYMRAVAQTHIAR